MTIDEAEIERLREAHAEYASALQEDGDLRGWVNEILRRQKVLADLCATALPALLEERELWRRVVRSDIEATTNLHEIYEEQIARLQSELDAALEEIGRLRDALGWACETLKAWLDYRDNSPLFDEDDEPDIERDRRCLAKVRNALEPRAEKEA